MTPSLINKGGRQTNRKPPSPPLRPFPTLLKWHHTPIVTSHNTARSPLYRFFMPLGTPTESVWNRQCHSARLTASKNHTSTHTLLTWLSYLYICQLLVHHQGYLSAQCGGVGTAFLHQYCLHRLHCSDTRVHCQFATLPSSNPVHRVGYIKLAILGGFAECWIDKYATFLSIMVFLWSK